VYKIGFFTFLFLSAQVANAAPAKLFYVDVEKILLSKNKDIQIATLSQEQQEHNVSSSYSGFLPTLTYYNDFSNTFDSTESTSKKIYSNSIGLTQNLFSGFQDYYKVKNAKLELAQANNSLSLEKLKQVAELKTAFANLLLAQRMMKFSERIIETRKGIKELVSLRFSSGNETQDSMLFADGQLEESNLDLSNSVRALDLAKRKLKFLIGEELPTDFEAAGSVPLIEIPTNPDFQKLSVDSLDFKNAALSERKGIEELKSSKAKYLPTVDFSVLRERENKRSFSESNFNKIYSTKYAINVTFPLFEGFSTYHDVQKSELEAQKNKLNLVKVSEDYYLQLKETFDRLIELKKKKEIYLKLLEASKLRDMIYTSKYRLGIISFEVWIDSQNDLISYEKSVIEIDFEIETNLSKWETLANARG
jgi:outer membrane protein TolC